MSDVNVRGRIASPASPALQQRSLPPLSRLVPFLFLLPGAIMFALFILWPMLYSLRISFYQWNIVHPDQSVGVGLQNYADTLADPIFQRSVLNTLIYGIVTVPAQIVLGIIVAML